MYEKQTEKIRKQKKREGERKQKTTPRPKKEIKNTKKEKYHSEKTILIGILVPIGKMYFQHFY